MRQLVSGMTWSSASGDPCGLHCRRLSATRGGIHFLTPAEYAAKMLATFGFGFQPRYVEPPDVDADEDDDW